MTGDVIDTLLICGSFFGYAREIKSALEARGRRVAHFEDRPATDSVSKALIRIAPSLMTAKSDAYFERIASELRDQPIRSVLVVKGESLSPKAIRKMREAFPAASFTLYFWDSYRNMPRDSGEKVPLFDRALSFDPRDVEADARLTYRPLFFVERHAQLPDVSRDIDVLFFGTVHGDRYAVVERIARALPPRTRFERILYFPAGWLYAVNRLTDPAMWGARREKFIFQPKSREELATLTARTHIVLDIERPIQMGFTMRTLEVLGAGRKLITTNPEVRNADFYNPTNIAVVDRRVPLISDSFLSAPYVAPPAAVVARYSLNGWLDDVLPETRMVPVSAAANL